MGPYFREVTGYKISNVGTFGIFSGGLLPLEFTSFHATADKRNTINLHWQVADVANVSHFVVEHSADGLHFQKIGQEEFREAQSRYAYSHWSPAAGVNYYRIRSVDYDGKTQYSPVATARVQHASTTRAHLDGQGQLHVWMPEQTVLPASVRIYDVQGRKLLERNINSHHTIMPLLPSMGMVLVHVNGRAFLVK
jgi:hypothetical protein